jgi:hypothetical protein
LSYVLWLLSEWMRKEDVGCLRAVPDKKKQETGLAKLVEGRAKMVETFPHTDCTRKEPPGAGDRRCELSQIKDPSLDR